MSEDTGKAKEIEQKQQAELTADDLDQVAGGITATHSTTTNETLQKVVEKFSWGM